MKKEIEIFLSGEKTKFRITKLPYNFLEWQSVTRQQMFHLLREHDASKIKMQPGHLPVMATWSKSNFPVNLATRGMGLVPKEEFLEKFSLLFEQVKEETQGIPIKESLPKRLAALEQFYHDVNHFDESILGGLEIFEGQTSKNLEELPLASLLYTGTPPKYPSYQFNGVISRVEQGNPYFRFLLAARELFATDAFHIHQLKYPFGYLFTAVEIKDKTPYPRHLNEKNLHR
jgi:hypothetical protein